MPASRGVGVATAMAARARKRRGLSCILKNFSFGYEEGMLTLMLLEVGGWRSESMKCEIYFSTYTSLFMLSACSYKDSDAVVCDLSFPYLKKRG